MGTRALWLMVLLWSSPVAALAQSGVELEGLYDRIAADVQAGAPLRVKLFVALCDNDSQGIVPVKNPRICDGDAPRRNLYWATSGGLQAYLDRNGWKRARYEERGDGAVVRVHARWRKSVFAGGALRERGVRGRVGVEIEALAYRGLEIRRAMEDYLKASRASVDDEPAHVLGYIGHNYLLDGPVDVAPAVAHVPARGAFALACLGTGTISTRLNAPGLAVLLHNRGLTYPGAWTVGGIVRGLAEGHSPRDIHRLAARYFADARGKSRGAIRRAFAYGR